MGGKRSTRPRDYLRRACRNHRRHRCSKPHGLLSRCYRAPLRYARPSFLRPYPQTKLRYHFWRQPARGLTAKRWSPSRLQRRPATRAFSNHVPTPRSPTRPRSKHPNRPRREKQKGLQQANLATHALRVRPRLRNRDRSRAKRLQQSSPCRRHRQVSPVARSRTNCGLKTRGSFPSPLTAME